VIGTIFYSALGAAPGRGTFVDATVVAMSVNAALVAAVAATTLLLPRRAATRQATAQPELPAAAARQSQATPPRR
jgi:hypothetical protein